MQLEGGVTLYKSTNTHLPQSVGTAPVDWRIVNGRKTAQRSEIDGQFADIRRRHGLTRACESVLPHWDQPTPRDRCAGFARSPPRRRRTRPLGSLPGIPTGASVAP